MFPDRAPVSSVEMLAAAWKAPETFQGKYSPASDIFSYVVLCFEVITRSIPWRDNPLEGHMDQKRIFDPGAPSVQKKIAQGRSLEDLREEWLDDNPLWSRRPEIAPADPHADGCPTSLLALMARCWADYVEDRPTCTECIAGLVTLHERVADNDERLERDKERCRCRRHHRSGRRRLSFFV